MQYRISDEALEQLDAKRSQFFDDALKLAIADLRDARKEIERLRAVVRDTSGIEKLVDERDRLKQSYEKAY